MNNSLNFPWFSVNFEKIPKVFLNLPDFFKSTFFPCFSAFSSFAATLKSWKYWIRNITANIHIFYTPKISTVVPYQKGFHEIIKFQKNVTETRNTSSNRNITCSNQPYSFKGDAKIAKKILQVVNRQFQSSHKVHNSFSHNTVKVSYSSLTIFPSFTNLHNNKDTSPMESVLNIQWMCTITVDVYHQLLWNSIFIPKIKPLLGSNVNPTFPW